MTTTVAERCLCGSKESEAEKRFGLPLLRCSTCSVLRQDVRLTSDELSAWYAARYFDGIYGHTYEHDRAVAEIRLDAYGLALDAKVLDVGCGNGAFIDSARSRGLDAWGQDLADESSSRAFVGDLADVAFPPASFDVVTVHDVLEHVPDPVEFLGEIARVLRFGGDLILDFPRFFHESGDHHWKTIEHLWMLDENDLSKLLACTGFVVDSIENPIPSKIVVRATMNRTPDPVRILVPPGIGDGYWVFAKLRGFLEERGIYLPEVFVHDSGPRRADGFWEKVPFVRFGGFAKIEKCEEWDLAYKPPGKPVQENVQGFDFFLSFNGTMDSGDSLDTALAGPLDWYDRIHRPWTHENLVKAFRDDLGDYVLVAFWDRGFYGKWLGDFGPPDILRTLRLLADAGKTVVVMGAEWDRGSLASKIAGADPRFVDMIGDTCFNELFALVDGAAAVFGHPAGNTMLGPFLARPTALVWGNTFPTSFRDNALPPRDDYFPIDAKLATPESAARIVLDLAP